ncbi:hypothetical protein FIBSPDRAFT_1044011 [Athelia psychrophila]|uniref:Uncharacterized protein n=1 Tax=Athelia psychrophila TaxID=1759441 RepID=A0A166KB13_9AGAM|nr:hypothetical protein FIBSPDRAFT_1044011 [Fibularhizoctonia sp. CBS 109695]
MHSNLSDYNLMEAWEHPFPEAQCKAVACTESGVATHNLGSPIDECWGPVSLATFYGDALPPRFSRTPVMQEAERDLTPEAEIGSHDLDVSSIISDSNAAIIAMRHEEEEPEPQKEEEEEDEVIYLKEEEEESSEDSDSDSDDVVEEDVVGDW